MSNLIEIGANLGSYLTPLSPQVKEGHCSIIFQAPLQR